MIKEFYDRSGAEVSHRDLWHILEQILVVYMDYDQTADDHKLQAIPEFSRLPDAQFLSHDQMKIIRDASYVLAHKLREVLSSMGLLMNNGTQLPYVLIDQFIGNDLILTHLPY